MLSLKLTHLLGRRQFHVLENMRDACKHYITERRFGPRRDPLDRLPLELVTMIFNLAIAYEPEDKGTIRRCPSCAHLAIVLSHVSSRWRYVSLNLPRLWTKIGMGCLTPAEVSMVLPRSQDLPLRVLISDYNAANVSLLRQHAYHIYLFQIEPKKGWDCDKLRAVLALDLRLVKLYNAHLGSVDSEVEILKTRSSTLRCLFVLDSALIPYMSCPSLGQIVLVRCRVDFSSILTLLSQCPRLGEVVLHSQGHLSLDQPISALPTAVLSRLRFLSLAISDETILMAFFQKVTWDHSPMVQICMWYEGGGTGIGPVVADAYAVQSATKLCLSLGNEPPESIEGSEICGAPSKIIGLSSSSAVSLVNSDRASYTLALDSLDLFPSGQVKEFWMGPATCPSRQLRTEYMVAEVLRRLTALETLNIHMDYLPAVLHAFSTQITLLSSPLCPKLAVIRVGWTIDGPSQAIPGLVFDILHELASIRPTLRLFIGTRRILQQDPPFDIYDGEMLTLPLPEVCTDRHLEDWYDWTTPFDPLR